MTFIATDKPIPDEIPILECRDLSISYFTRQGEVPAVVDFNLKLNARTAHGLVGESGCGKSTIALAIMQYLGRNGRIVKGQILFQGRDMLTMSPEELRRIRGADIAMVYQEPMASLNPSMRIGDQLSEVLTYHRNLSGTAAFSEVVEILQRVRLPDPQRILRSFPHQISGGQQQRVIIAMALLSNPKVLLLDEPTTALDVTIEAGIVELIREISERYGTTMLYVSHNLGLIRETCHELTVMYSGEAVEAGPVDAIFASPRHPYTRGLFNSIPIPGTDKFSRPLIAIPGQLPSPEARPAGCNFGPRCAFFVAGRCNADPIPMLKVPSAAPWLSRCIRLGEITGEPTGRARVERSRADIGAVAVEVDGLSKRYGHLRANEDINFTARSGETVAIVGESGCGKSTLAKIVMGLEAASSGTVRIGGRELGSVVVEKRPRDTIRNLQMVFQNPFDTLNPSHSVGAQIARVIRKFGAERDEAQIKAQVLRLLDLVKIPHHFATRRPHQLSGGQKQRIGIARAFAGKPAIVVADEPISALDVSVQAAVTELLMDIQQEIGTTLLFISHDLSVVRYLADRVVVMYVGKIVEQGTADEVFAPPYHPYTEALLSAIPIADPSVSKRKVVLSGELPSPANPPTGCPFSTRCPYSLGAVCRDKPPMVHEFTNSHRIVCHLPREELLAMEPMIVPASSAPPPEPQQLDTYDA